MDILNGDEKNIHFSAYSAGIRIAKFFLEKNLDYFKRHNNKTGIAIDKIDYNDIKSIGDMAYSIPIAFVDSQGKTSKINYVIDSNGDIVATMMYAYGGPGIEPELNSFTVTNKYQDMCSKVEMLLASKYKMSPDLVKRIMGPMHFTTYEQMIDAIKAGNNISPIEIAKKLFAKNVISDREGMTDSDLNTQLKSDVETAEVEAKVREEVNNRIITQQTKEEKEEKVEESDDAVETSRENNIKLIDELSIENDQEEKKETQELGIHEEKLTDAMVATGVSPDRIYDVVFFKNSNELMSRLPEFPYSLKSDREVAIVKYQSGSNYRFEILQKDENDKFTIAKPLDQGLSDEAMEKDLFPYFSSKGNEARNFVDTENDESDSVIYDSDGKGEIVAQRISLVNGIPIALKLSAIKKAYIKYALNKIQIRTEQLLESAENEKDPIKKQEMLVSIYENQGQMVRELHIPGTVEDAVVAEIDKLKEECSNNAKEAEKAEELENKESTTPGEPGEHGVPEQPGERELGPSNPY